MTDIAKYRAPGYTDCWFVTDYTMAQIEKRLSLDEERSRAMTALEKRIEDVHEENQRLRRRLELNGISI